MYRKVKKILINVYNTRKLMLVHAKYSHQIISLAIVLTIYARVTTKLLIIYD
jgi:hypothetical protein